MRQSLFSLASAKVLRETLPRIRILTSMVELGLKGPQTGLNISQALSIGQLCEGHAEKLIQTGELAEPVIALVTAHALVELVPWGKKSINWEKTICPVCIGHPFPRFGG